jgi:Uma2 family endonuclease
MATAHLPRYITVAEFEAMQFDDSDREYELLDGEIVEVSHPGFAHYVLAQRLARLLREALSGEVEVGREMPFVLQPSTRRKADVAVLSAARYSEAASNGCLEISPEIVVEIVSPSNLTSRDRLTATLCLQHGALQFWMVHPQNEVVDVYSTGGIATYAAGSSVALPEELGGGEIVVAEIFAEL